MKSQSCLSRFTSPRCEHLSPSGRRCTQPVCPSSPHFCFTHIPAAPPPDQAFLLELSQAAADLSSPEDVNRVLAKIFRALIEDRLSIKKAGTLSYIAQMILRTQREIAFHKKIQQQEAAKQVEDVPYFTRDIPRPIRGNVYPEDIERKERELAQLKKEVAEQAANSAALEHAPASDATLPVADLAQPESPDTTTSAAPPPSSTNPRPEKSAPLKSKPKTPPPPDLNHFYPWDPTLPPGRQDATKNVPPPDPPAQRMRLTSRQYYAPINKRNYY